MKKLFLALSLVILSSLMGISYGYADIKATSDVTITSPSTTVGTANYFRVTGFNYIDNLAVNVFSIDCSVGKWTDLNNDTKVDNGEVIWLKSWTVKVPADSMKSMMSTITTGKSIYIELQNILYNYLKSKNEIPAGF